MSTLPILKAVKSSTFKLMSTATICIATLCLLQGCAGSGGYRGSAETPSVPEADQMNDSPSGQSEGGYIE